MSWSITFSGNEFEVEKQFQKGKHEAKLNNLPKMEQVDIGDVSNLLRAICMRNRVHVQGSASGHWIVFGDDDPRNRFGGINLSISFMKRYEDHE